MIIPTLLYHHVTAAFVNSITVSPQEFQAQMQYLYLSGYRTLSVTELLSCLKHRRPVPKNAILITFDDGYEDIYTNAFSIMREFGFSALIFPIIEAVDHWNEWNRRAPYVTRHLSWEQMEELTRYGFEFGCHTMSHHSLVRFGERHVRTELKSAQDILAQQLGRPIQTLSYPYGDHNDMTQRIAADYFELAFAVDSGVWNWLRNPWAVRRLKVAPQVGPDKLAHLLSLPASRAGQTETGTIELATAPEIKT